MTTKRILLCTVALCLSSYSVDAQNVISGPRYTPRADVSNQNYTATERHEDRVDAKSYEQYEEREPCQNYRRLPRNYNDGCFGIFPGPELTTVQMTTTNEKLLPIDRSYTVLFDFDRSTIRANEGQTIGYVMHEITKYNPTQITVTGYADSSGSIAYNQILSQKREQAVSHALLARGIRNQAIDRNARGEFDQAVNTPDNTRNQENRRVVIDFRR